MGCTQRDCFAAAWPYVYVTYASSGIQQVVRKGADPMSNGNENQALSNIRIIDFSQFIAGPLASMLLADFGADVIRVDPPGGPRWEHPSNAILHRNKRSIILDLKSTDGLEFARRLIATADVVIEGFRPGVMTALGLDAEALCAEHPGLIWCSIPGFGHDDPRAEMAAYEGIICSAAGMYPPRLLASTGGPRFSALTYASNFGGFIAAHSIVAALISRERYGFGDRIEVPLFDAVIEAQSIHIEDPASDPPARFLALMHAAGVTNPAEKRNYRARDGRFIYRDIPERGRVNFWNRFLPERLLKDESPEGAAEAAKLLEGIFATRDAREWEHLAQTELRAAFGVQQTSVEWLHDEHARQSECAVAVEDPELGPTWQAGFGVRVEELAPRIRTGRHLAGADQESVRSEVEAILHTKKRSVTPSRPDAPPLPLAGLKMIDFSTLMAGPGTGRLLAEYGIECTKVTKASIAYGRINNLSDEPGMYAAHRTTGAGKKTIFLDMRTEKGKDIAQQMAARADVICTNFAVDTASEMGVGLEQLQAINPGLIYAAVNTHGRRGSRERYRGHEQLGQAVTGATLRFGGPHSPEDLAVLINDFGTPHLCALGILIAFFSRFRSGTEAGCLVEAALSRTATIQQLIFQLDYEGRTIQEPMGPDAKGWNAFDRIYYCEEGAFYLAAIGEQNVARLRLALDLAPQPDWSDAQWSQRLEDLFRAGSAEAWVAKLTEAGVPAQVYCDYVTLAAQSTLKDRRMAVYKPHLGMRPGWVIGNAARFAAYPERGVPGAARPGWHTFEVMRDLGLDASEIDQLVKDEIIAGPLPPGSPID